MVSAWYTLIVGILISLSGIIFLIFPMDNFEFPNWYLGLMLLVGVVGIILGVVSVSKKKKTGESTAVTQEQTTEEPKE
jgi:uncharacterized membrane protein HdeD (DUF308 family)